MKFLKGILIAILFLSATMAANADTIDFVAMANPGGNGESAYTSLIVPLSFGTLTITGSSIAAGTGAYAYLDSGFGGLGVCSFLLGSATTGPKPGSSANLCNPSSDDNATAGDALSFVFDVDVIIDTIWMNNNHDGDTSLLGDTMSIGGADYTFTNGGPGLNSFTLFSYIVNAGVPFIIANNNIP
ncbi:MAG TPA: hypothetical protein VNN17_05895, partial [Terriglobia bacterium]|nr:hypothetical protein [Terriglobia bacterium]